MQTTITMMTIAVIPMLIPTMMLITTKFKNQQEHIQSPSPLYYFESHSRFDSEKFIEEKKEQTIDSECKIHHSLKRRIDDKLYETEQIEDENGQVVNKETWHNVSEDEVEKFKQKWISNSNSKLGLTENHKNEEENEQKQYFEDGNNSNEEEESIPNEEGKEEIKDDN